MTSTGTSAGTVGPARADAAVVDTSRDADVAAGDDATRPTRGRTALLVAGLTAVVVLPLVVALVALRSPRWHPVLDLAMTELRVRDVGTGNTPLVGLVGRLSSGDHQGSHPGPLSFWALAPTYRVLGSSAWSLLVGVVVLNTAAVALSVWIALRRGGTALALAVAAALAVLVHLYGTQVLTEPWNPYMPVMWWALTLLAVWAVACDDLAMLPVAVFAASFCLQTHISYLGLVGGFGAAGVVALVVRARRLRGEGDGDADRAARRRLFRWSAVGIGLAVVLWLPPIIDQVTGDPGNASIILDNFREPDEDTVGLRTGVEVMAVQLNPWRFLAGQHATSGAMLPGLALLAAWATAAIVWWRRCRAEPTTVTTADRSLLRLHAVVAVALVLGLASASRILGFLWYYLTLWVWGITLLTIIATVWTALAVARRRGRGDGDSAGFASRSWRLAGAAVLAAVLVTWPALSVIDASDAHVTDERTSAVTAELTDAVAAAIDEREAAGRADDRYLLTWTDGIHIGAPGFGMLNELERRGYDDVGVLAAYGPGAVDHRVLQIADATAEIHISFGPDIPVWDEMPGAERLASVDLRTDEQRARAERARRDVLDAIERAGRDELVELVDTAPFMLWLDDRLPPEAKDPLAEMNEFGQPAAVYLGPVTLASP
jgi:hypothetical protein